MHCELSIHPLESRLATSEAKLPLGHNIQAKQMHMSSAYMQDEAPAVVGLSWWDVCIVSGLWTP